MASSTLSALVLLTAGLVYYFFIFSLLEEVLLESKFGTLKGFKEISRDGRKYNSFKAIPYGKPPVGELRFQPPIPSEKWQGVRDATVETPKCLQADALWKKVIGQEDCLYLNVYTPKIPKSKTDKLLPVMVFIHGGYFMFGGTDLYRPNYFMDEDVVLVTINYRLGAFGFLSTGDDVVSGNMGMKDQVLALKWVQAAIKEFGGDPNLVTVFGESAGSGSVHFHMFSHLSAGLFHRGISQSGSSFCPWANVNKDVKSQARKLGDLLNCPSGGSSETLVKCLRAADGNAIAEIQKKQFVMEHFYSADIIFSPTLEKGKDTSKAFLTTNTRQLSQEGKLTSKVPWLAGVNSAEGCWKSSPIFNSDEALENFSTNWKTLAPKSFIYYDNPDAAEKIRKHYFGQSSKKFVSEDYARATEIFSDRYFFTCHGESTRAHSKHAPTYSYYFSHANSEGNGLGLAMGAAKGNYPVILELLVAKIKHMVYTRVLGWSVRDYGVCHADELMYLFYTIPTTGIWKDSPHYEFSKSLVKLWVNFAKNGYPGKYNGIEWEEVIPDKLPRSMHLGEPAGMIDEPFTAQAKFWNDLKLTPK